LYTAGCIVFAARSVDAQNYVVFLTCFC